MCVAARRWILSAQPPARNAAPKPMQHACLPARCSHRRLRGPPPEVDAAPASSRAGTALSAGAPSAGVLGSPPAVSSSVQPRPSSPAACACALPGAGGGAAPRSAAPVRAPLQPPSLPDMDASTAAHTLLLRAAEPPRTKARAHKHALRHEALAVCERECLHAAEQAGLRRWSMAPDSGSGAKPGAGSPRGARAGQRTFERGHACVGGARPRGRSAARSPGGRRARRPVLLVPARRSISPARPGQGSPRDARQAQQAPRVRPADVQGRPGGAGAEAVRGAAQEAAREPPGRAARAGRVVRRREVGQRGGAVQREAGAVVRARGRQLVHKAACGARARVRVWLHQS